MPPPEGSRFDLYHALSEQLGEGNANELMRHLPAYDPSEIATKSDLGQMQTVLKADIDSVRSELKADFARLEARFDRLEDVVRQQNRDFMEAVVRQNRFYAGTLAGSMTCLTAIFSFVVVLLR